MINNDWKERAIERRIENKALKKRIKELTQSRDLWRDKSAEFKKQNEALTNQINNIKKKLIQIDEM